MNTNTAIVGGIIAIVALVGLVFYFGQSGGPAENATSTPPVTNGDNGGTTPTPAPQAGAPRAVTNSNVAPSESTAVVNGTVNPNGAFTSYWYEYGVTTSFGNKTSNQNVGAGYADISAPDYITGLSKDTTYYFRLVAENQFGRVAGTQYAFRTTLNTPPPVGSAPLVKSVAANGISRTTANLNGEVTPNKAATQYWFEYGKTSDLGQTSGFTSVGDGTAKVLASAALANLDPLTTYYFRLNAQNQFGTVNGGILNFRTAGPAPVSPSAPSATTRPANDVARTTAVLRGTVDANSAETTYWFEYSTDSLLGSVLLKSTAQKSAGAGTNDLSVSADVTGLAPDTTYYFRLVAQNSLGTDRGDRETFKTRK